MDIAQIQELVKQMDALGLRKIVYKKGDFEIHLEKEDHTPVVKQHAPMDQMPQETTKVTGRVEEASGVFVTSPMVGTFYASPGPDLAHFVKVGDRVHEKTVVCIVEAMKVMNEVKAGVSGTIVEMLVQNGHPVEFGTRLFRVVV